MHFILNGLRTLFVLWEETNCFFFPFSFLFLAIPCNLSNVTIKHAQVPQEVKKRYRTGETFVLGCQSGYKPVGNGSQECNEGNWTTQKFYCESEYIFL